MNEAQSPDERYWDRVRELEYLVSEDQAYRMIADLEYDLDRAKRESAEIQLSHFEAMTKKTGLEDLRRQRISELRDYLGYEDDEPAEPIEALQEAVEKYPQYVRTTRCRSCSQHKRIDELESKLRDVSETARRYKQERDELQWMYDDLCK